MTDNRPNAWRDNLTITALDFFALVAQTLLFAPDHNWSAAGHPKTLSNSVHLGKFLNWVKNQQGMCLDLLTRKSTWWMDPDDVVGEITRSR